MKAHPRTMIRLAVVDILKGVPDLQGIVGDRVFANRFDAWNGPDLPGISVYTKKDVPHPEYPDGSRMVLSLDIETIARMDSDLDALLEAIAFTVERQLSSDAVGLMMRILGAKDTLISLAPEGTEMGLAADAVQEYGVCVQTFAITYFWPESDDDLVDFDLAGTRWNLPEGDPETIHAEDLAAMNPETLPIDPDELDHWGDDGKEWPFNKK